MYFYLKTTSWSPFSNLSSTKFLNADLCIADIPPDINSNIIRLSIKVGIFCFVDGPDSQNFIPL